MTQSTNTGSNLIIDIIEERVKIHSKLTVKTIYSDYRLISRLVLVYLLMSSDFLDPGRKLNVHMSHKR